VTSLAGSEFQVVYRPSWIRPDDAAAVVNTTFTVAKP
jgi:hypothetical protein